MDLRESNDSWLEEALMQPDLRGIETRLYHLVLIPGFVGFDALGQLGYFGGTTPIFRKWQKLRGRNDVVLHYFDNFPTASVSIRAKRLRNYLSARFARGEFAANDKITLIGHSTGGLDTRRLLCDLFKDRGETIPVDGIQPGSEMMPSSQDILNLIDAVVFISVPQFGTNIANWIDGLWPVRMALIDTLKFVLKGSQVPIFDKLEDGISHLLKRTDVDLVLAARDALSEVEPVANDDLANALAQQAAAELGLWLRHISSDFKVIKDLSVVKIEEGSSDDYENENTSPAHFSLKTREKEKAYWGHIRTRSYATISKGSLNREMDVVYRTSYRACSRGPYKHPVPLSTPTPFWGNSSLTIDDKANDGIVNTASMLWPDEEKTLLVECDHMDIVGHYVRTQTVKKDDGKKNRRTYSTYDLLMSRSDFDAAAFEKVWMDLFDYSVEFNPKQAELASTAADY